jgi:glycosyltransferase involved in cell wall biosynthesis
MFSIVITTYNRSKLLARAIASAQLAGRDPEIVVVDDASTDETRKVCRSLKGIRYIRTDRRLGVAGARNVGIRESSGEYICFLDDDDERLPGSIDIQLDRLEADPHAGVVYGPTLITSDGAPLDQSSYPEQFPQGDVFWKLLEQNFIPCGSVVFRRSAFMQVGPLDENIPGIDDWDLWLRMAEHFNVVAVEQPVYVWRRSGPGSGQGSSSGALMVRMAVRQFREHWMRLDRVTQASHKMRRAAWRAFSEGMARHLIWDAARAQRTSQTQHAAENIFTGLTLVPAAMLRVPFDQRRARSAVERFRALSRMSNA